MSLITDAPTWERRQGVAMKRTLWIWEGRAGVRKDDYRKGSCYLCKTADSECTNCIVYKHTHEKGCTFTPYEIWHWAAITDENNIREHAKAELDFLISILPAPVEQ